MQETNKLTAREFAITKATESKHKYTSVSNFEPHDWVTKAMVEFATYHVQKALEAASNKIELTEFASEFLQEGSENAINLDSILSAYPFENIK